MAGFRAHEDRGAVKPNKGGGWETFKQEEANDLPVWLKTAGYRTALIGKYENGYGAGKPPRLASAAYWANALNGWFGIGTPDKQHWVPQGWDVWYAFTTATTTTRSTTMASFSTSVTPPPTIRPTC